MCACVVILSTQFCRLLTFVSRGSFISQCLYFTCLVWLAVSLATGINYVHTYIRATQSTQHRATGGRVKVHSPFTHSMKGLTDEMIQGLSSGTRKPTTHPIDGRRITSPCHYPRPRPCLRSPPPQTPYIKAHSQQTPRSAGTKVRARAKATQQQDTLRPCFTG